MKKTIMRSKIIVLALVSCMVLSACGKTSSQDALDIKSVKLKGNQKIVIAQISEIYGNEIKYTVAKESSLSQGNSSGKGNMPQGSAMPQGSGAPDGNNQMPSGSGAPDGNRQMPSGKSKSGSSSTPKSKTVYSLTDETGSTTIPVGTKVITSLGNVTTFSRLSSGDVVKMIVETDSKKNKTVVGVWIVS